MEKILSISIEELGLSVKAFKCLKRAGIHTVEDLLNCTVHDVRSIPNLGKGGFEDVLNHLHSLGLCLKEEEILQRNKCDEIEDEEDFFFFDDGWQINEPLNLAFASYDDKTYSVKGIDDCSNDTIIIPNVYLNKKVTSIYWRAFRNQNAIVRISIPETITHIGPLAFAGCTSLTAISLPDELKTIDSRLFYRCTSLEEVSIPKSVNRIAIQAFGDCSSLKYIYFDGTIQQWETIVKMERWDKNTGDYTIYCTNGNISK